MKAQDACFDENATEEPSMWASCGKNDTNGEYLRCAQEDVMCGKLQCRPKPDMSLPTFPVLGGNRGMNCCICFTYMAL